MVTMELASGKVLWSPVMASVEVPYYMKEKRKVGPGGGALRKIFSPHIL